MALDIVRTVKATNDKEGTEFWKMDTLDFLQYCNKLLGHVQTLWLMRLLDTSTNVSEFLCPNTKEWSIRRLTLHFEEGNSKNEP